MIYGTGASLRLRNNRHAVWVVNAWVINHITHIQQSIIIIIHLSTVTQVGGEVRRHLHCAFTKLREFGAIKAAAAITYS